MLVMDVGTLEGTGLRVRFEDGGNGVFYPHIYAHLPCQLVDSVLPQWRPEARSFHLRVVTWPAHGAKVPSKTVEVVPHRQWATPGFTAHADGDTAAGVAGWLAAARLGRQSGVHSRSRCDGGGDGRDFPNSG